MSTYICMYVYECVCDYNIENNIIQKSYEYCFYLQAYYCSICESLLLNISGLICDSCGVCADPTCVKIADKQLKCKLITVNTNEPMKHHWIKGMFYLLMFVYFINSI